MSAPPSDTHEWYLAQFQDFEKRLNGDAASELHSLRRAGLDRFAAAGLPSSHDEDWRHAGIGAVTRTQYSLLPSTAGQETVDENRLPRLPDWTGTELVFLNGRFSPELSTIRKSSGVEVSDLAAAAAPDLARTHLDAHSARYQGGFAALNTAFLEDGAFVHLTGAGAPVYILYVTTPWSGSDEPFTTTPRTLIVADAHAEGMVVEHYIGLTDHTYLTNAVTELSIGSSSTIHHCKIHEEGEAGSHVATMHVAEARDCAFTSHNFSLSGRLVRNDITTLLDGEGIESTLNGLFLGTESEHIDNHTTIEHARPHCSSHELYKGVLGGRATGVFRGKIHVHPDAQQTDAYQSNRNLIVSPDANITSKPQLEIYADDVKCSHGSTTGQLDADAIFYLRTRGLSTTDAVRVLTEAFAGEIVDRVPHELLRDAIRRRVETKLESLLEEDAR